jgi:hypothetical protein
LMRRLFLGADGAALVRALAADEVGGAVDKG